MRLLGTEICNNCGHSANSVGSVPVGVVVDRLTDTTTATAATTHQKNDFVQRIVSIAPVAWTILMESFLRSNDTTINS